METYRRLLQERLTGQAITDVSVQREKTINIPAAAFEEHVKGTAFSTVERRGKHILFRLQSGRVLLLHLMLGGFLYWGTAEDKLDRTAQMTISVGRHVLYFHGLRLGYLHLLTQEEAENTVGEARSRAARPPVYRRAVYPLDTEKARRSESRAGRSACACRHWQLLCRRALSSRRDLAAPPHPFPPAGRGKTAVSLAAGCPPRCLGARRLHGNAVFPRRRSDGRLQ